MNRRDADRRADYFSASECWECIKDAERAATKAAADASGLPGLQGSPRQIEYAMSMRASTLARLDAILPRLRKACASVPEPLRGELYDALILHEDEVRANTSAKFWIETRGDQRSWARWFVAQIADRHLAPSLDLFNQPVLGKGRDGIQALWEG